MTTTPRRPYQRALAWMTATTLALALAACGGSEDESDQGASSQSSRAGGGGSSSEQSPPGSDADEADGDEADGDETDTNQAQEAAGTDCLVGTWLADNEQLGALFKSAAAGTDAAGAVSDPTGKVLVTFGPGGEYGVDYQNWTMKVTQQGMTIELVRDGTDTGSYEATDDGSVEWTEVTMGSVATMNSPAGSHQVPGEATSTSGTFVCEQDTLQITAEGSTTAFDRQ